MNGQPAAFKLWHLYFGSSLPACRCLNTTSAAGYPFILWHYSYVVTFQLVISWNLIKKFMQTSCTNHAQSRLTCFEINTYHVHPFFYNMPLLNHVQIKFFTSVTSSESPQDTLLLQTALLDWRTLNLCHSVSYFSSVQFERYLLLILISKDIFS